MNSLNIGNKFEPVVGRGEGVFFEENESGYMLIYCFKDPRQEEIDEFTAGKPFEIRFLQLGGAIWILSKVGNLSWTDAPYNPNLNKSEIKRSIPNDGQGTSLTLMLCDADTGTIKHMRLIGLGTQFSRDLIMEIEQMQRAKILPDLYYLHIAQIQSAYPTNRLVDMAKKYYKLDKEDKNGNKNLEGFRL